MSSLQLLSYISLHKESEKTRGNLLRTQTLKASPPITISTFQPCLDTFSTFPAHGGALCQLTNTAHYPTVDTLFSYRVEYGYLGTVPAPWWLRKEYDYIRNSTPLKPLLITARPYVSVCV